MLSLPIREASATVRGHDGLLNEGPTSWAAPLCWLGPFVRDRGSRYAADHAVHLPPCPKCGSASVEVLSFTSKYDPLEWMRCLHCGRVFSELKQVLAPPVTPWPAKAL